MKSSTKVAPANIGVEAGRVTVLPEPVNPKVGWISSEIAVTPHDSRRAVWRRYVRPDATDGGPDSSLKFHRRSCVKRCSFAGGHSLSNHDRSFRTRRNVRTRVRDAEDPSVVTLLPRHLLLRQGKSFATARAYALDGTFSERCDFQLEPGTMWKLSLDSTQMSESQATFWF